ncbi:MAG: hypothetical protein V4521_06955 [Pseudomonadota bacterium]
MEFVFEVLLQFGGEILLQALFEVLAELGMRSMADTLRKPRTPLFSTIGFILWGFIAGGISLLLFPTSPIADPTLRAINLFITPTAIAAIMMLIGRVRTKKGQTLVRLDRFGYAFVFAFGMALVRYIWVD